MSPAIKIFGAKLYTSLILIFDTHITVSERFINFAKVFAIVAPVTLILDSLNLWFDSNKEFATGIILMIMINMFVGAITHKVMCKFKWRTLILKTLETIVVTFVTYIVIELILNVAGENRITNVFETTLQIATLLYPASKILKNIFILSNGKHPPKWIMQKIYDFQESGDLSQFLSLPKDK